MTKRQDTNSSLIYGKRIGVVSKTKKKTTKKVLATLRQKTFTMPKVKETDVFIKTSYPNYTQSQLEGFQDKLNKQIRLLQEQLRVVEFLLNNPEAINNTWVEAKYPE